MSSKSFRREISAYAVCAAIGATIFAAGYGLDRDDGLCSLLHPNDAIEQADCRAAAVVREQRD